MVIPRIDYHISYDRLEHELTKTCYPDGQEKNSDSLNWNENGPISRMGATEQLHIRRCNKMKEEE
jgi:hypothetical protein